MKHFKGVILAAALFSTSACGGFLTIARGMKDTKISADESNYAKLAESAKTLGWASQRGTGKHEAVDDWDLTVVPGPGQKVIFTRNNQTGKISFNCTGAPLDDRDPCIEATNKVLKPLGWVYEGN